ncbi:MAG: hypothetical protein AB1673_14600 [Actinomycetota bacterium]|jgi:hypothetical protein
MGEWSDQLSDWVVLYWLEQARSACKELRGHLQLLLAALDDRDSAGAQLLLAPADTLRMVGAIHRNLDCLGRVVAQLERLPDRRLDPGCLDELRAFTRAVAAHPQLPISLLLRTADQTISAHMRVGTPPPEVFAALRWHTDDSCEWSIGTHIGTLPAAVRHYYNDLTDIDEEANQLDRNGPG